MTPPREQLVPIVVKLTPAEIRALARVAKHGKPSVSTDEWRRTLSARAVFRHAVERAAEDLPEAPA